MKYFSTKNGKMGKDFFSKETMISKFPEAHDTVHRGFTLVRKSCISSGIDASTPQVRYRLFSDIF